jgi:hypothetical protein
VALAKQWDCSKASRLLRCVGIVGRSATKAGALQGYASSRQSRPFIGSQKREMDPSNDALSEATLFRRGAASGKRMEGAVQPKIPLPSGRANERVRKHCEAVTRPGGMPNSAVSQVFCLT